MKYLRPLYHGTLCAILSALSVPRASGMDGVPPADSTGLNPPVLMFPSSGMEAVPVRTLFRWMSVEGAKRYWLEVGLDSLFLLAVWSDSSCADTSVVPATPLLSDTLYYWRVRAGDSLGWGPPAPADMFRTGTCPVASLHTLHFPYTRVGDSAEIPLSLVNPGRHPVVFDSAGSASGRFLVASSLPPLMLPGETLQVRIRFRPDAFMAWSEPFRFFTAFGPVTLTVNGNSPPPLLALSAERVAFGPMASTDTGRVLLRIYNRGYFNDLTVKPLSTRTPFFHVDPRGPFRIAPGESVQVAVRFHVQRHAPGRFGFFPDTILVESNGGAVRVPLLGDVPHPRPWFAAASVQFGDVRFSDSSSQVVKLYNRSPNTLRIDSVRTITSAFRAGISGVSIRPWDSATVTIRFTPWSLGVTQDTLLLVTNGLERRTRIPIRGVSPFPTVGTTARSVDFGEVLRGEKGKVLIGIHNSSVNPLAIESLSTRGEPFAVERWSVSDVVRRGDTLRVTLLFTPKSAGRFRDTLVVSSNAPDRWRKIPLTGVGVLPDTSAAREGEDALFPNYPNPFKGSTTFRFSLALRSYVRLAVYNSLGQELAVVMEGEADAGFHNVRWQTEIASGVYFYKLVSVPVGSPEKQSVASRRLMVLK